MSYILDALRKSEKERRRGEIPGVLSQQDAPYPARKRRSLWPYLIAGALVINVAVLLIVFSPWQQKSAPIPTAPPSPAPETAVVDKSMPKTAADGGSGQEAQGLKKAPDLPPEKAQSPVPEKKKPPSRPEPPGRRTSAGEAQPNVPAAGPPQQPEAHEDKAPQEIPPAAPGRVYSLTELPPALKQRVPALSLSLTVHSDDRAARLATVNGQTVREGQNLQGGVRVEEILTDSVIFTFQGYRFSVHMR